MFPTHTSCISVTVTIKFTFTLLKATHLWSIKLFISLIAFNWRLSILELWLSLLFIFLFCCRKHIDGTFVYAESSSNMTRVFIVEQQIDCQSTTDRCHTWQFHQEGLTVLSSINSYWFRTKCFSLVSTGWGVWQNESQKLGSSLPMKKGTVRKVREKKTRLSYISQPVGTKENKLPADRWLHLWDFHCHGEQLVESELQELNSTVEFKDVF